MSIGVATVTPGTKQGVSDAVSAADRALYRAKELGGNVVAIE